MGNGHITTCVVAQWYWGDYNKAAQDLAQARLFNEAVRLATHYMMDWKQWTK
jgi:hypothetical protein